jgi:methyl-accepting chemotaxis protein
MKLIAYFGVIALLVGVVGIISTSSLSKFDETVDILAEEHLPIEEALHDIKESVLQEIRHSDDYIFTGEQHHKEELEKHHQQFETAAAAAAHEPLAHGHFEHVVEVGEEIQELHHEFDEHMDTLISHYEQNPHDIEGILERRERVHDTTDELFVHVEELMESEHHEIEDTTELIHATEDKLRYTIWGSVLLAIIFSIGLGLFVSQRITKPLEQLSKTVDEVSKGNFKVDVPKTSSIKEINTLAESLDRIMKTMKVSVMKMREKKK